MNMFKGLLFLHGHFTRPEDLEDAPATARAEYGAHTAAKEFVRPLGNRAASAAWFGRDAGTSRQAPTQTSSSAHHVVSVRSERQPSPRKQTGFLTHLLYLGGRPMHAGHNFDIDEPFEQFADEDRPAAATARRATTGSGRLAKMQACTG